MKVLDLPDNEDNSMRQILLKQNDDTLEELAKKSKQEIQVFVINEIKRDKNEEAQKQAKNNQEKTLVNKENNEKFNRLLSAFPKSVLDKNQDIATMLEKKDFEQLLTTLKNPKRLEAIVKQL
jgi:hypothetical protein